MPIPMPDDPAVVARIRAYSTLGPIQPRQITADLDAGGLSEKAALWVLRNGINNSNGVIKRASAAFGASRQTMYNWMQSYPELAEFARKLREDSGEHQTRIARAREAIGKPKRKTKKR